MSSDPGRNIPAPIKRQVRQRCGFGCVICGDYPYQYHHMIPYAVDPAHKEENLTLLCDKHHKKVTNRLLTDATVSAHNADPYNQHRDVTNPDPLDFSGAVATISMGSCEFIAERRDFVAFSVDAQPIIGFHYVDDRYMLCADLRDEQNVPLITIVDNELTHTTKAFDVERIANRLILRDRPRRVSIELEFDAPSRVTVTRGQFWMNGVRVWIDDRAIRIDDEAAIIDFNRFRNIPVGVSVGRQIPGTVSAIALDGGWRPQGSMDAVMDAVMDALRDFNSRHRQ
ncbi:HNH endonuclease [Microbacterium sp. zg.Y1084]|uniref:HNH endonuclease n=1 Tax=Microbacterium sp. zg.Y1084 TaxID=2969667 RepID=UPI00214AF440|nr:HNH endonuclease signature motif containing protein [Microbacterium sp. zg.Y1084]MCR2811540.1 HNH endonuclease [Microbacterium sp. zg.Y1084]